MTKYKMAKVHELAELKGKSVTLTEQDFNQCLDFVNENYRSHLSGGRNTEKVKSDILHGKAGEIGFYKLAKEIFPRISEPDFSSHPYGDGYYDFILKENLRTDVKCVYQYGKSRVFFKPVGGYEILSLVEVNGSEVTYVGSITRGDAVEKAGRIPGSMGNMGFFVSKSLFEKSSF